MGKRPLGSKKQVTGEESVTTLQVRDGGGHDHGSVGNRWLDFTVTSQMS